MPAVNKYNGYPCEKCGQTERYISNNTCVRCRDTYRRAEYQLFRDEHIERTNEWHAKNREKHNEAMRLGQLRRKFGMTAEDYERLLTKQNGKCAICEGNCLTGRRLAVDHSHTTNQVRGLLCQNCNIGLGKFKDDPKRLVSAVGYLLRASAVDVKIEVVHRADKERDLSATSVETE